MTARDKPPSCLRQGRKGQGERAEDGVLRLASKMSPLVSWETAAPVCGLLRGPLPRRPGMGAALTPVQKRNRHFPPGPTHTLKKTLKKDSQAIAWLSSFIPLPGDSCRGWGRHPQAGGLRGGRPTALPRRGRAVLPAQRAPLLHRDRCPPATQGFPGNCPPG